MSRIICQGKLRVVTTEWVAFCLRLGEYVDPSTSPTFCLPRDPARHPLVTKTAPVGACLGAIKGVGGTRSKSDRFVVGDIVRYDTGESGGMSNPSYTTIAYARIFEFFRYVLKLDCVYLCSVFVTYGPNMYKIPTLKGRTVVVKSVYVCSH